MSKTSNNRVNQTSSRKAYLAPKVMLPSNSMEPRGGFLNPAVTGEVKFPSLPSTSNYNFS